MRGIKLIFADFHSQPTVSCALNLPHLRSVLLLRRAFELEAVADAAIP